MADRDAMFMKRALELAQRGRGWVDPNPMVGCVIVKDDHIIGEGWHTAFGKPHAEREALAVCAENPEGATVYVTLEPCCHYGKTPPCTEALIEAKVARVVVGSSDPNPEVAGKGVRTLRDAGIQVDEGILREECDALNTVFFHYITTKQPYTVLKYAMTLDGKVATRTGASRWITGTEARQKVHEDRARFAAIMVGVDTVIIDDPMLTCRLEDFLALDPSDEEGLDYEGADLEAYDEAPLDGVEIITNQAAFDEINDSVLGIAESGRFDGAGSSSFDSAEGVAVGLEEREVESSPYHQPVRVVCDTHLRTPLDAQLVRTAKDLSTLIATCESDAARIAPYEEAGCTVLTLPEADGRVDLQALMGALGERGIDSVIIEGGPTLAWSALRAGIVKKVQAYIASKAFGGTDAPTPVGGLGVDVPDNAFVFTVPEVTVLGSDVLLECGVC